MNEYSFGNFLYELRTQRALSQQALGEIVGVSNAAVSKWETGKSIPSMKILKKLSQYFEISVEELLEGKRQARVPVLAGGAAKNSPVISGLMVLLFAGNFLTLFLGLAAVAGQMRDVTVHMTEKMWLLYLFLPIPVSSVVLGFICRAKGYKTKKNIVGGAIFTFLLLLYGSFTFFFAGTFSHDFAYLDALGKSVGVQFPATGKILTESLSADGQTGGTDTDSRAVAVFADGPDLAAFEAALPADERWVPALSSALTGTLSPLAGTVSGYDYALLYNVRLDTYNQLPAESGVYEYVFLAYCKSRKELWIYEYSKFITAS